MAKELICKSCGTIGKPKTITKGSIFIEIVLWIAFIVPGLIYSIWRHTSRYKACKQCYSSELVPKTSPIGQKILAELSSEAS